MGSATELQLGLGPGFLTDLFNIREAAFPNRWFTARMPAVARTGPVKAGAWEFQVEPMSSRDPLGTCWQPRPPVPSPFVFERWMCFICWAQSPSTAERWVWARGGGLALPRGQQGTQVLEASPDLPGCSVEGVLGRTRTRTRPSNHTWEAVDMN